ncbi:hypothetical protein AB0G02_12095 [Actinosynnema sp. NPDC023658]|uniref:hypothetical protein n=1 Tax=Actinosynnema sp. NPDC023658 TaxID=3155465 RepID=UPI0033FB397C
MHDDPHGHSSGHDFHDDDWHEHDFHDDWHGRRRRRRHLDLATAPTWVKVLTWVGALTALAGLAVFGLAVFGGFTAPKPEFGLVDTGGFPHGGGFATDVQVFEVRDGGTPYPTGSSGVEGVPDGIRTGMGLFFVGLVLSVIAGLGHATSRPR